MFSFKFYCYFHQKQSLLAKTFLKIWGFLVFGIGCWIRWARCQFLKYIPASLATYLLKCSKFCICWVFASKKVNKFLSKNEIWKCIDELTYILVKRVFEIQKKNLKSQPYLKYIPASLATSLLKCVTKFLSSCFEGNRVMIWGSM